SRAESGGVVAPQNRSRCASEVSTRNDQPCVNPALGARTAWSSSRSTTSGATGSGPNRLTMRRRRTTSRSSMRTWWHPEDHSEGGRVAAASPEGHPGVELRCDTVRPMSPQTSRPRSGPAESTDRLRRSAVAGVLTANGVTLLLVGGDLLYRLGDGVAPDPT